MVSCSWLFLLLTCVNVDRIACLECLRQVASRIVVFLGLFWLTVDRTVAPLVTNGLRSRLRLSSRLKVRCSLVVIRAQKVTRCGSLASAMMVVRNCTPVELIVC